MLYRNTKTGALVDSVSVISGGNWVAVEDTQETETPIQLTNEEVSDEEEEGIELSKMTVADLKVLASDLNVDLEGATKKDDIINAILKATEE